MAGPLDPDDLASFDELLIANYSQNDAMVQLLNEEGIITHEKFLIMKQV